MFQLRPDQGADAGGCSNKNVLNGLKKVPYRLEGGQVRRSLRRGGAGRAVSPVALAAASKASGSTAESLLHWPIETSQQSLPSNPDGDSCLSYLLFGKYIQSINARHDKALTDRSCGITNHMFLLWCNYVSRHHSTELQPEKNYKSATINAYIVYFKVLEKLPTRHGPQILGVDTEGWFWSSLQAPVYQFHAIRRVGMHWD